MGNQAIIFFTVSNWLLYYLFQMKATDFSMRTGFLECYLKGTNLVGVEIGSDVGAHAESILTHCSIEKLTLVDPWVNPLMEGICIGRLFRWRNRVCMEKMTSEQAVKLFGVRVLDFVYIDQLHDYDSVKFDLTNWWGKLKEGGILALRNYNGNPGLKKAADEFIFGKRHEIDNYLNEILIFK